MQRRLCAGLAILLASGSLLMGSMPVEAAVKTCFGQVATQTKPGQDGKFRFTPGDDVIVGTNRADSIVGIPGSQGGTDYICSGSGADLISPLIIGVMTIDSGAGADIVAVYGTGTLVIEAGSGNDSIHTNVNGTTEINGESGNDYIEAIFGNESVQAGSGNDHIVISGHGDGSGATVFAGSGRDRVEDSGSANSIDCGPSNDTYSTTGAPTVSNCEKVI